LLARRGFPVCVLTKSDLIIRDADIFARMTGSSVGVSMAFHDEEVRRLFESRAPSNERRIEALKRLKNAGLETYALICPVMPFLTDAESLIEAVAPYADTIWIYGLSMRSEADRNWQNVKDILDHHFLELTRRYRRIAFSPDDQYWSGFRRRLEGMQVDTRLKLKIML
jgi:DNA repair photolyase